MLEKGGAPEPKTVHHLDRCLSCLSCMTTCAVKVDYVHLIDRARAHIERHFRRPLAERLLRALLAHVLPHPRRFARRCALGRLAQLAAATAAEAIAQRCSTCPRRAAAAGYPRAAGIPRAKATREARVALLAGCAQQALDGDINAATIRLLHAARLRGGDRAGRGLLRRAAPAYGARGGGARVRARKMSRLVGRARRRRARCRRRQRVGLRHDGEGLRPSVRARCRMASMHAASRADARRQRIRSSGSALQRRRRSPRLSRRLSRRLLAAARPARDAQPRALLRAAGFEVVDVPERHFCCGSAGTYNLLQPEIAEALGQRKAAHIESTDPDIVATGNLGCMMQIGRYLGRPVCTRSSCSTGRPAADARLRLRGRTLREPARRAAAAHQAAPDRRNDDIGIW